MNSATQRLLVAGAAGAIDVALDYRVMADRIIHGTLGEVLAAAGHALPAADAFETADALDDLPAEEPESAD